MGKRGLLQEHRAHERAVADVLLEVLDGRPLTPTAKMAGDTTMIDRACWLWETGHTFEDIQAQLGVEDVADLIAAGYAPMREMVAA